MSENKAVHRFSQGRIPEALIAECEQLSALVRTIASVVAGIVAALTEPDESKSPTEREEQGRAGVELGAYRFCRIKQKPQELTTMGSVAGQ